MAEGKIEQIMSKPVKTVNVDEALSLAASKMHENAIGNVVVLDGDIPVGIITERDLVKAFMSGSTSPSRPVRSVMSKPLITISPDASLREAIEIMITNNVSQLPVLRANQLVGIVTEKDLMRALLLKSYDKLSRPKLRELEVDVARVAAELATLLNL
jgi:CBS domain-containing protein